jgi:hypothetical protein
MAHTVLCQINTFVYFEAAPARKMMRRLAAPTLPQCSKLKIFVLKKAVALYLLFCVTKVSENYVQCGTASITVLSVLKEYCANRFQICSADPDYVLYGSGTYFFKLFCPCNQNKVMYTVITKIC